MVLMIIFLLVAVFSVFGLIGSLRDKNLLGMAFSFGSLVVFSWFSIMTILHHGFPTVH